MESIFHRVSIRKYQEKPVEKEKLEKILRAAMAAPSARNQQPWEYYVVTNKEKIKELSEVTPYTGCAKNAAVVFAACYRKDLPAPDFAHIDMSASVENLLLEIDNQGLGAVWLGIAPVEDRMQEVERLLNMEEGLKAFALIACGYPAEERPQQDRFEEDRVHYVE